MSDTAAHGLDARTVVSPANEQLARLSSETAALSGGVDALAAAAPVGDPPSGQFSEAVVTTAAGLVGWEAGRVGEATSLLERAIECTDPGAHGLERALPQLALAAMLTGMGRMAEAERCLGGAGSAARSAVVICRARLALAAGRLEDAVDIAHEGMSFAQRPGTRAFVPIAHLTLAMAALLRGDLLTAASETARYREAPPPPAVSTCWATFAWANAQVLYAQVGAGGAFAAMLPVYDDLATHQRLFLEEPAAAVGMVRLALDVGEAKRARAVTARAGDLADANRDVPSFTVSAAHARGVLERDPIALESAAIGHAQPWAQASAAEDHCVVLGESRDRAHQVTLLERALDGYLRCGATRDAARVRARLRARGVRHRHGTWASRPVEGWESLTESEHRIAVLVAEGLTNQETGARIFVSRHTVDFHLRQIFRKLRISSRVELTRTVLEHGGTPRDRGM